MPVPRVRIPASPLEAANTDDSRCQKAHESPENKGYASSDVGCSSAPSDAAKAHEGDSSLPEGVRNSAKQNAKQNAKRISDDPDLTSVIDAWPDLPEAIKAAIMAMVQTAAKTDSKTRPQE